RTVLMLTAHGEPFEEANDDLEYFAGPGGMLSFPEPDQLAYDASSPHPAITAQRLETLARLVAGREAGTDAGNVVLATVRGLLQRGPKPAQLAAAIARPSVADECGPH